MKKYVLFTLVLILTGCSALQPVPPTPQPTPIPPTPEVIVATVLVPVVQTVIPTQAPTFTPMPTDTALPTLPPTEAPTQAATATAAPSGGPFPLDDNLGDGFFKSMTYSTDNFSLRCVNKSVTFNVTAADSHIFSVELFYRVRDKNSTDISPWIDFPSQMKSDLKGNFTVTLTADLIDPDWRRAQTWIDFQFVGVNNLGDVVGRTEKFIGLINYSNDCPK